MRPRRKSLINELEIFSVGAPAVQIKRRAVLGSNLSDGKFFTKKLILAIGEMMHKMSLPVCWFAR
jgi:hypothetical protein